MIIKCKGPRGKDIICKVWSDADKSTAALALEYEQKVYAEKIDPIVDRDPNAPLIKYHGYGKMNGDELSEFVGNVRSNFQSDDEYEKSFLYLYICLFLFSKNPTAAYEWENLRSANATRSTQSVLSLYPQKGSKIHLHYPKLRQLQYFL